MVIRRIALYRLQTIVTITNYTFIYADKLNANTIFITIIKFIEYVNEYRTILASTCPTCNDITFCEELLSNNNFMYLGLK